MIELYTGVPGAGKTLSMVERLHKLQKRWQQHPEETRPVFVSGIPDLKLDHQPLPMKSVQVRMNATPMLVPAWEELPEGSLILIDESQGVFPPRSTQIQAPEHVAFLNVHRHKGFDIWLTTQHPKLIDGGVRALVGRHQHYRRLFGGARAVVYEWDSCSDSLTGFANATKSYYSYPKNVFHLYKSAEVHTKQSFKLPLWIYVPLLSIPLGAYFIPNAYNVFANGMGGQGLKLEQPQEAPGASPAQSEGEAPPPPEKRPLSVPVAISEPLQISGCIASATACRCYTATAIRLSMSDEDCRAAAEAPNEYFRLNTDRASTYRSPPPPPRQELAAVDSLP